MQQFSRFSQVAASVQTISIFLYFTCYKFIYEFICDRYHS